MGLTFGGAEHKCGNAHRYDGDVPASHSSGRLNTDAGAAPNPVNKLNPGLHNPAEKRTIDLGKLSSYSLEMPRRKAGTLLPLEVRVLEIAKQAQSDRTAMYGFALASALSEDGGKSLAGHGTLYKALARLAEAGLLESEWEDPENAEAEGRPRRRLYRISSKGVAALSAARTAPATTARRLPTLRPVQP